MSFQETINQVTRKAKHCIHKNSPAILTAIGISSFVGAIILAAKKAPEANQAVNDMYDDIASETEHNYTPYPDKKELAVCEIKTVAPYYAPVAALAVLGTACILSAHKIQTDKTAAFATAYELSETVRREYVGKVREKIGIEAEKELNNEAKRPIYLSETPQSAEDSGIICTGNGNQLFCDCGTGLFFRSSLSAIQEARMNVSQMIFLDNDIVTGNTLLSELKLPPCKFGNLVGFDTKDLEPYGELKLIDMRWDSCYMTSWGETYAVVEYFPHTI